MYSRPHGSLDLSTTNPWRHGLSMASARNGRHVSGPARPPPQSKSNCTGLGAGARARFACVAHNHRAAGHRISRAGASLCEGNFSTRGLSRLHSHWSKARGRRAGSNPVALTGSLDGQYESPRATLLHSTHASVNARQRLTRADGEDKIAALVKVVFVLAEAVRV